MHYKLFFKLIYFLTKLDKLVGKLFLLSLKAILVESTPDC